MCGTNGSRCIFWGFGWTPKGCSWTPLVPVRLIAPRPAQRVPEWYLFRLQPQLNPPRTANWLSSNLNHPRPTGPRRMDAKPDQEIIQIAVAEAKSWPGASTHAESRSAARRGGAQGAFAASSPQRRPKRAADFCGRQRSCRPPDGRSGEAQAWGVDACRIPLGRLPHGGAGGLFSIAPPAAPKTGC